MKLLHLIKSNLAKTIVTSKFAFNIVICVKTVMHYTTFLGLLF